MTGAKTSTDNFSQDAPQDAPQDAQTPIDRLIYSLMTNGSKLIYISRPKTNWIISFYEYVDNFEKRKSNTS